MLSQHADAQDRSQAHLKRISISTSHTAMAISEPTVSRARRARRIMILIPLPRCDTSLLGEFRGRLAHDPLD
jgi:hypothetical protein